MGTIKDSPDDFELRQRAEEKLKEAISGSEDLSGVSPERMANLIHELQVHQIELEMQNDELRRIQGELEKTRDKYSHLYDFAPVGYFTVSEKGIIEEVNLTGASMTGIERNALIGKPFSRFVLREDQDIFYKYRQRLLETETSRSCELRLVRNDGHDFYACMECMVIKNKGDDLRQIRAAVSDITERKRAEEVLEVNLIKYQTLFESLPIGITISDKAGKILEINKKGKRLLELSSGEYGKRKIDSMGWRIIRPDGSPMPAHEYASVRALRENHLVENVEMGIVKKEGDVVWINVTAVPIPLEGYGVIIAYSDITERKRMEEELLRAQKLESVGMLAGGIAHDFNNILTAILGNVSMAKNAGKAPEDDMFDLLTEAETASTRAQTLTGQLLTFAKGGAPVKEDRLQSKILSRNLPSLFCEVQNPGASIR